MLGSNSFLIHSNPGKLLIFCYRAGAIEIFDKSLDMPFSQANFAPSYYSKNAWGVIWSDITFFDYKESEFHAINNKVETIWISKKIINGITSLSRFSNKYNHFCLGDDVFCFTKKDHEIQVPEGICISSDMPLLFEFISVPVVNNYTKRNIMLEILQKYMPRGAWIPLKSDRRTEVVENLQELSEYMDYAKSLM